MNVIEIHQLSDFNIISDSTILIAQNNTLREEEIAHNMWCISLSDALYATVTRDDIVSCLKNILNVRQLQINSHMITSPITMYVWFDEMALQLRLNFISGCNQQLPFGCRIKHDPLEVIVEHFFHNRAWPDPIENAIIFETQDDKIALSVFSICLKSC